MELNFSGTAFHQVRNKCSEYFKTAKTKIQAFCRNVERHDVYKSVMGTVKGLRQGARLLWRCIFSRKATQSETNSSIRLSYAADRDNSNLGSSSFAGRAGSGKRETGISTTDSLSALSSMEEPDEFFEILQDRLFEDMISARGEQSKLLYQKVALLVDLKQFQTMRESTMAMSSERLANDLYSCQTEKELYERLDCKDVPVMVRNELKAKLKYVW